MDAKNPVDIRTDDVTDKDTCRTSLPNQNVSRIVSQIELVYKQKGERWDTLFYKIVLGGNVGVIKSVIEYMEKNTMISELNWILGIQVNTKTRFPCLRKSFIILKQLTMFVLLGSLVLLIGPVFYAFHGFIVSVFGIRKKRSDGKGEVTSGICCLQQKEHHEKYDETVFIQRC